MRGDMPKVIVERPRRGAGWSRKGRSLRDDDLILSESDVKTHARTRWTSKELNENLAPLRRYLESQVNRPWDKVWSEICKNLKPSNTVQQHVRDHIPDFVAIKTSLKGGEVWVHDRYALRPLKGAYVQLYVDPKSGLLRRNKHFTGWKKLNQDRRAAAAKARDARMRVISEDIQLHLAGDCWWEVRLAPVPTMLVPNTGRHGPAQLTRELAVDDVLLRALATFDSRKAIYGREGVYGKSKRQLSKKEIRDHGLRG
jgi:hypothetical protein